MGLDMYLEKIKREAVGYKDFNIDEVKTNNQELYKKIEPYLVKQGSPGFYEYDSLFEEIMYWRKANQIHRWFVENVQDGFDDCRRYEVSKEQLEELKDTCKEILNKVVMCPGVITNGYTFSSDGKKPIYENGYNITNPEVCEDLLPTASGFFFGSTDYDNYYIEDIKDTYEKLCKILKEVDFTEYAVYYSSSW